MENKKIDRPYMASYLLAWYDDIDERSTEAERLAGLTDSEIKKEFQPLYSEMQGVTPPPIYDDDPWDYGHIPC